MISLICGTLKKKKTTHRNGKQTGGFQKPGRGSPGRRHNLFSPDDGFYSYFLILTLLFHKHFPFIFFEVARIKYAHKYCKYFQVGNNK